MELGFDERLAAEDAYALVNYEINEIYRSVSKSYPSYSGYAMIPGFYAQVSEGSYLAGVACSYWGGMSLVATLRYPGAALSFDVRTFRSRIDELYAESTIGRSVCMLSCIKDTSEAIKKLVSDLAERSVNDDAPDDKVQPYFAEIGYFTLGYTAWQLACKSDGVAHRSPPELWSDEIGRVAVEMPGRRIYDAVMSWWLTNFADIDTSLKKFRKPHEEMRLSLVDMIRKDNEIRERFGY